MYIYIYIYIYIYRYGDTKDHLSNTTCLTQGFFKSGESIGRRR